MSMELACFYGIFVIAFFFLQRRFTLTINEPLPSTKELTEAVEEHWIKMIHDELVREGKTGIPVFDKAFVMIEITTPRGTHNCKLWVPQTEV